MMNNTLNFYTVLAVHINCHKRQKEMKLYNT
jgi:hypothetical protein